MNTRFVVLNATKNLEKKYLHNVSRYKKKYLHIFRTVFYIKLENIIFGQKYIR